MASVGGVKVSAHYCGPHVPDPDARPRGAGGVGAHGDAAAEAAAAARVAEVVASNARLVRATCPHLETAPHYYGHYLLWLYLLWLYLLWLFLLWLYLLRLYLLCGP